MTTTSRHPVIAATDGLPLAATVTEPADAPVRATLLVLSATATPRGYYRRFAEGAAADGLRVVTFDYRGIGDSRPASLRGFDATLRDWAALDAAGALDYARTLAGGGPLVLVGHSFGGQALALCDALGDVDGAILVGAQLGFYGHWPAPARRRLWAMWNGVVPLATSAFGYAPGWLGLGGVDLPLGVAREWASWCASPGYLFDHVEGAPERLASFARPVLFLSFTDDAHAPAGAVRAFLRGLPTPHLVHARVSPSELGVRRIGHFGAFREDAGRRLWPVMTDWVHALVDGRAPRRAFPDAGRTFVDDARLRPEELMADLAYGRDAA